MGEKYHPGKNVSIRFGREGTFPLAFLWFITWLLHLHVSFENAFRFQVRRQRKKLDSQRRFLTRGHVYSYDSTDVLFGGYAIKGQ